MTDALRRLLRLASIGAPAPKIDPVEFGPADIRVLNYVIENRLTMASRERVIATIKACKHAVEAGVPGDFVECGVWRGGNSIAAKLTFEHYGSDKKVWSLDTFAGMTAPSEHDSTAFSPEPAADRHRTGQAGSHNEWCFASLEDVRDNFERAGVDLSGVRFVRGDVLETLKVPDNIPSEICTLRLDTDFYESTKAELENLYPRLSVGGVLLVDDFGHWQGARQAVEEYLSSLAPHQRPLLFLTDYTGRMAVKTRA